MVGLKVKQLSPSEYHPYYEPYIHMVGESDLSQCLTSGIDEMVHLVNGIDQEHMDYAYDTDKWTIGEVLVHLIDTERIFQYRALRFARGDKTPLTSFDQNRYVMASKANKKGKEVILKDFLAVRQATISLYEMFDTDELRQMGIASDAEMSVRALGFLICGHQKHHLRILRERYL